MTTSPTSGQGRVAGGPGQAEDAEPTFSPDRSKVIESGAQIVPPGLVTMKADSVSWSIAAPPVDDAEQFVVVPGATKERTTEEDPLASGGASTIDASAGAACAPSTGAGGAEASDGGGGGGGAGGGELAEGHAKRRANITQPPRVGAAIRASRSLPAVVVIVGGSYHEGRHLRATQALHRTSTGRTITRKMATETKKKRGALTRKLQIKVSPSQREAVIRASRRAKKPMATWVRDHILLLASGAKART